MVAWWSSVTRQRSWVRACSRRGWSSYTYPTRTELPIVTKTKVEDRSTVLESSERAQLQAQKDALPTLSSHTTPIESSPPSYIPPNVPAKELQIPQTLLTTLDNGVRVVSQETYGQVCTVGVVTNVGSRYETPQTRGMTHLLEVLAFGATQQYSHSKIPQLLQDWGGTRFSSTGREQSLHCIDILRPNVHRAMHLLEQVLLEPLFLPQEVDDALRTLEFQSESMPPELLLGEALQVAAYHDDQQLGQVHFLLEQNPQNPLLTPQQVHQYWQDQFMAHPHELVVAGAGIGHEQLVELTQTHFGAMPPAPDQENTRFGPSQYRGGDCFWPHKSEEDSYVRLALALEVGGWDSDELVPTCVLQTLLGGGNSFSAGGPGKGMYSRLYRQVLNKYSWAESAEAFTSFHLESGLWGMSGSAYPNKMRDLAVVLAEHISRLSQELVSDEELDRARNMLKCNVLTQLESRLVLFEDMGRQVLTYGAREDTHAMCEKIDAVSKEDLQRLVQKALKKPPTIAAVGEDLSNVPRQEEIARWFQ